MTDEPRPLARWDRFDHRGRAFLRAGLPGSSLPFTVAAELASRYRVDELFATSETGVLLGATDLATGRGVLVKALRAEPLIPPPGWAGDPAPAAREEARRLRHGLQTERRLLVRLRNAGCNAVPHPNDYVFDGNPALLGPPLAGSDGAPWIDEALVESEPYLVLRREPGVSLEALLAAEFPEGMDEADAIALIVPVVRVLAVLHQPWALASGRRWHCVYQDLKPANILVDPLGRPTLVDFGGCQVVVDGVPVLAGASTPGYAPPEAEGPAARVLLPGADVYTIGSTLYHMLTGIDPRELLERRRGRPGGHLELGLLPAKISERLRSLLACMLAPRPSDRPADARAVLEALAP